MEKGLWTIWKSVKFSLSLHVVVKPTKVHSGHRPFNVTVMKTGNIYSCVYIIMLLIMVFIPHEHIQAQDQNTKPVKYQDKVAFNQSHHYLILSLSFSRNPMNCAIMGKLCFI